MKRFFSIMSLLLVLVLSLTLFGCDKGGNKGGGGGGDIDFGGQEIVIVCYWDDVPDEPGPSLSSQRWYQRYKDLEKKYNCVFTCNVLVETEISAQFEAASLAQQKFGDIVILKMDNAKKFQKQSMLYDISKVMDLDAEYLNDEVTEIFKDPKTGAVYAFSNYKEGQKSFILFNKNIFDRYGVEYPYQYVENNTWTPEKFLDLATRTTNDAEGVKGFYAITTDPQISYFLYGFGGNIVYADENGLYHSGLTKAETIEGLKFIRDMNVAHKVTLVPEAGVSWTHPIEMFKAGKVAMVSGADHNLDDLAQNMDDDYGIVPYPKKPEIQQWANMHETHNVKVMQAILDDDYAKKLGKVYGEYMEPLATPDEAEALNRDLFETRVRDEESVEMLLMLNKIPLTVIRQLLASPSVYYGLVYDDLRQAVRGEKDLMTVIEADDPIFRQDIDATNRGEEFEYNPPEAEE